MIFIKFLDTEYEDIAGKFLDVMTLNCHIHGEIESWLYDAIIPWDELKDIVDDHLHSMHYT